jgi:hypothetical protein
VRHGRNSFKVDEYLDPTLEENVITLTVRMNTGGASDSIVGKTWYITAINLSLTWDREYSENNYISTDYFNFTWTPYGGVDCTTHIVFDDTYNENVTYFKHNIKAAETGSPFTSKVDMPSLPYGSHKCEMYLTAMINGKLE